MEETKTDDLQYQLSISVNGGPITKKRYTQRTQEDGSNAMQEVEGPFVPDETTSNTSSDMFITTSDPPPYVPTNWFESNVSAEKVATELDASVKLAQATVKTYAVNYTGPTTEWNSRVWATFDTQAEAADGAALCYQFICSLQDFKIAKVWVTPTKGDTSQETCIIKGAYFAATVGTPAMQPASVTTEKHNATGAAGTTDLREVAARSLTSMQSSLFGQRTTTEIEL